MFPVALLGESCATRTNAPPSTDRSTTKKASSVALSLQARVTWGPVCSVAVAFVGASGAATAVPSTGAEKVEPAAL